MERTSLPSILRQDSYQQLSQEVCKNIMSNNNNMKMKMELNLMIRQ